MMIIANKGVVLKRGGEIKCPRCCCNRVYLTEGPRDEKMATVGCMRCGYTWREELEDCEYNRKTTIGDSPKRYLGETENN